MSIIDSIFKRMPYVSTDIIAVSEGKSLRQASRYFIERCTDVRHELCDHPVQRLTILVERLMRKTQRERLGNNDSPKLVRDCPFIPVCERSPPSGPGEAEISAAALPANNAVGTRMFHHCEINVLAVHSRIET
ncbi:hypothetical protein [Paraburkholderia sp. PGU19]|uniref:hypothetical protein n=1 Tax=Paraburkholderia sp. PGU19 TaxID=2735434 RepID=UPI0015DA0A86|nr:hypothetical protein [Paraburkholderia sp. PGU19]